MKKGFLFTIGVVFIASTLIIFAQFFAGVSAGHERLVYSNSRTLIPLFVKDDVSFDILRVLGLSVRADDDTNSVFFSGSLSGSRYVRESLLDYNSFMNNKYLSLISGNNYADLSSLTDGSAEFFFGENSGFVLNYDLNDFLFYSGSEVSFIDVNFSVHYSGIVSVSESILAGESEINIRYSDDSNIVIRSFDFDPAQVNSFTVFYADKNVSFVFGDVSSGYGVFIDSNLVEESDFSVGLVYPENDFYSGRGSALIHSSFGQIDFNSQNSV